VRRSLARSLLNAPTCDVEVLGFYLDTDERSSVTRTGYPRRPAAHEWTEDRVAFDKAQAPTHDLVWFLIADITGDSAVGVI
jgi:hypothetical protein